MAASWKPVRGEKGIYVRDYGDVRTYQLQMMIGGRRYTDTIGAVSLERARLIRDQLALNRKMGAGPMSWKEMEGQEATARAAAELERARREREIVEDERRRRLDTVGRLWEERFWPHRLSLRRSAAYTDHIRGHWENHIAPFFRDVPLAGLEKSLFTAFADRLRKETELSDSSISKILITLRQLWNFALEEGLVKGSFPGRPVLRELLRDVDNAKKCWLTPDEARLLLQTAYERRLRSRVDHDVYCFIVLGLGLGMRAGEICGLTAQSLERHIIDRTKNRRSRFVHFNFAPVRGMLDERLALYPPDDPLAPLFPTQGRNSSGKRRIEVPRKYRDLVEELGFNETPRRKGHPLERIDFHALRHTFATLAAMRGVDHLTLMRLLGHKTPGMTLRYIEIADAHQARYQELAMRGIFPEEISGGKGGLPPG